ncbi:MAG: UDP-N-acetylglucosamine 1-carboxyvinyltransferase [Candidatus Nomurabacteria bacterium]
MPGFKITGGRKLRGKVKTNTSKNGAVNMIVAALLNDGETILHRIPKIEEVFRYIEVVRSINVEIDWVDEKTKEKDENGTSLRIKIKKGGINVKNLDIKTANMIRSFTFVGALIHAQKSFSWPHSGGCKMGERTVASHKYGLEYFGVDIKTKENSYEIKSKSLHPAELIPMYESSDTGAITLLVAASKIKGESVIKFAPPNYQVQDVCFLLEKFGVNIEGIGTSTLKVQGLEKINLYVEHYNSEDPIDAMFFISSAIVTNSTLTITNAPIDFLELELEKLKRMGVKFELGKKYLSDNGKAKLVDIKILARKEDEKLIAPHDKIHTGAFPAINNDNLPFFVPIATLAEGITLIHDWTWENRAIYFTELNRLGGDLRLADPHRVYVNGVKELKGAEVVCPPALRPAAIILVAMLSAKGVSILRNVYSIKRGYEGIAERLNKIGAKVEVLKD